MLSEIQNTSLSIFFLNRKGKLDLAELLEGFRSMGFELNSKKISEVANVFDVDGSGRTDFEVLQPCSYALLH